MTEFNILISSAGRRIELMQAFRQALRDLGINGAVCAADCSLDAPALHLADNAWRVPKCREPGFIPELLEISAREKIHLIVPTIDAELEALSLWRSEFQKCQTHVAISAPDTVLISTDKLATHEWLVENGFPTVAQAPPEEVLGNPSQWNYPLIAKPRYGSASKGVRLVRNSEELRVYADAEQDLIVQSVAEGFEHTINVYVDTTGACVCAVPHRRLEVRAGEVSKAVTVKNRNMMRLACDIAERLPGAKGPLNIQCFLSSTNRIDVIEINARFGGGYPLAHRAGARFTQWLLQEALEQRAPEKFDAWTDDLVMLRYDQAIFQPGHEIRSPKQMPAVMSSCGSGRYPLP